MFRVLSIAFLITLATGLYPAAAQTTPPETLVNAPRSAVR